MRGVMKGATASSRSSFVRSFVRIMLYAAPFNSHLTLASCPVLAAPFRRMSNRHMLSHGICFALYVRENPMTKSPFPNELMLSVRVPQFVCCARLWR